MHLRLLSSPYLCVSSEAGGEFSPSFSAISASLRGNLFFSLASYRLTALRTHRLTDSQSPDQCHSLFIHFGKGKPFFPEIF